MTVVWRIIIFLYFNISSRASFRFVVRRDDVRWAADSCGDFPVNNVSGKQFLTISPAKARRHGTISYLGFGDDIDGDLDQTFTEPANSATTSEPQLNPSQDQQLVEKLDQGRLSMNRLLRWQPLYPSEVNISC